MPTTTHTAKFTYDDYLLFPNDGKRYELIEGERFVTPAPRTRHQRISSNLHGFLFDTIQKTQNGMLFSAPTDVVLSEIDILQPDLLFVSRARTSIITEENIQGAPDLVVEILSESTRRIDEIIKRKLYEHHGVHEYWIIDPEVETIKVYRATEQGFQHPIELTVEAHDRLTSPLFPEWELPLLNVFQ